MLAVSGRLDRTPFGPPVPVVEDAVGQVVAPDDDSPRRSVYLQVRRTKPVVVPGRVRRPGDERQLRAPDRHAPPPRSR